MTISPPVLYVVGMVARREWALMMGRPTWAIWAERRSVIAVLAVVEVSALIVPALLWRPVTRDDLVLAVFLGSLSISYSVLVAAWERVRQHLLFDGTPRSFPNFLATWCFAAALLLPPTLVAVVIAVAAIGEWPAYKLGGGRSLYRWVYSNAAAVLAAMGVCLISHSDLPVIVRLPGAVGVWIAAMTASIGLVICASGQLAGLRTLVDPRGFSLEFVTIGIAIVEYGLRSVAFPLMWLSLPAALYLQRVFTRAELNRRDADPVKLLGEAGWLHIAQVVVEGSGTATIMRVDSADPKAIRVVSVMCARSNAMGLYDDGRAIAVLFPDLPPEQADGFALQVRAQLRHHGVDCDVVTASKPRDGEDLDTLLLVSDAAMMMARAAASGPARSA